MLVRPLVTDPSERPAAGCYPAVNGQASDGARGSLAFQPGGTPTVYRVKPRADSPSILVWGTRSSADTILGTEEKKREEERNRKKGKNGRAKEIQNRREAGNVNKRKVSSSIPHGRSSRDGGRPNVSPPSLPVLSPSPPFLLVQLTLPGSFFDGKCSQQEAPGCARKEYSALPYAELHQLRGRRGFARRDSKVFLKARLSAVDASGSGKTRDTRDELPDAAGKRKRSDEPHLAFALGRVVAKGRAQVWNPSLKDVRAATECPSQGGWLIHVVPRWGRSFLPRGHRGMPLPPEPRKLGNWMLGSRSASLIGLAVRPR